MSRSDFKIDLGGLVALIIAVGASFMAVGGIRSDLAWLKEEMTQTRERLTRIEQDLRERPPDRVRAAVHAER